MKPMQNSSAVAFSQDVTSHRKISHAPCCESWQGNRDTACFFCARIIVMSLVPSVALDVRRVSPVRGQLEPYDPRIPKGCRYIQCTETPDELKA